MGYVPVADVGCEFVSPAGAGCAVVVGYVEAAVGGGERAMLLGDLISVW